MLAETLRRIGPLDVRAMEEAQRHQRALAIPEGSLGRFHECAVRLAGITGMPRPRIHRLAVVTMAGDHGVTVHPVSRFPREVTRQMVENFRKGGAAINALTRHVGARLTLVDVGVAGPPFPEFRREDGSVRFRSMKIGQGTSDMATGAAMSREEAVRSVEAGIKVLEEEWEYGLDAVGTGDMGIGNTTPSSAIAALLSGRTPEEVVNRGTGIDSEALRTKIRVVARALEENRPDPRDPLDVLSKIGGYEIGGIAGVILGGCARRIPVVIDGFISSAAALVACRFHPCVAPYLFAAHRSAVSGHDSILQALGLRPLLDLEMRLGEGTGAALGLWLLSAASRMNREMLTFEQAAVSNPEGT